MKKLCLLFISFILMNICYSQIIVDNSAPYSSPNYLVNQLLLNSESGLEASNISFQDGADQIGFFDATLHNLDIDSGIVLSTGDIYNLSSLTGSNLVGTTPPVEDPDLLTLANSVPGLIGVVKE
ncbi:MAG: choice-of-anchor L domain-containing protein [Flavobacteriales bacterium]